MPDNLQVITEIVVIGTVLLGILLTIGPKSWAMALLPRLKEISSVGGVASVAFLGLAAAYTLGAAVESLSYEITEADFFVFIPAQIGKVALPRYREVSRYGGTHSDLITGVYENLYSKFRTVIPDQKNWGPPQDIIDPGIRYRGWAANIQSEHIGKLEQKRESLQRFDIVSRLMRGLLVDWGVAVLLALASLFYNGYRRVKTKARQNGRSLRRIAFILVMSVMGYIIVYLGWASAEVGYHTRVWFAAQELLLEEAKVIQP